MLTAEVLPENHKMVQVFRDSGFPVATHSVPGALGFEVPSVAAQAECQYSELWPANH